MLLGVGFGVLKAQAKPTFFLLPHGADVKLSAASLEPCLPTNSLP